LTADELLPRIKGLVVASLKLEGVTATALGDDESLFAPRLGLDSVDALELVVALEREFGVAIPSEVIGGEVFATPRSLAAWLAARLDAPDAAAADR